MAASYTDDVKTWIDKTDLVDDVFAGDINGAYHEIIAIEEDVISHKGNLTAHGLGTGVINTPTISLGANTIQHTGNVPVYPEIDIEGMSYVNLPGKDGDCEDTSKWSNAGIGSITYELYSTDKVFGNYSFKLEFNALNAAILTLDVSNLASQTTGKYLLLSGYIKNVSVSELKLIFASDGTGTLLSEDADNVEAFTRYGLKIPASTISSVTACGLYLNASNVGVRTAYMDGVMLNEISETDYTNLTLAQLLAKYPYVESYGCLTNPSFENRRYNLIRNGNCEEGIGWWKNPAYATLSIVNDKFQIVTTEPYAAYNQVINVKANTDYYINASLTGNTSIQIANAAIDAVIKAGVGTFNSGSHTQIAVMLINNSVGTGTFDSIMLTEGTTAPTEYLSCDPQQFVVEGQFTSDDTLTVKDGRLSGELWWKHPSPLYGKDYAYSFAQDIAGSKVIWLYHGFLDGISNSEVTISPTQGVLKHVVYGIPFDVANQATFGDGGSHYISIADSDSGWAESIAPNADEVKAYMNGWKATANDGTRYTAWVSVVDGVTVPASQTIDYVKNNIATDYEGYRLHYKLANPEPITDANVHVHGDIWSIVPGYNYVNVDSGIVLGEVANPVFYSPDSVYVINSIYSTLKTSMLKNKTEDIIAVYRNEIFETHFIKSLVDPNSYGKADGAIALALYDANAVYAVDYQILKTLHAQSFGSLTMSYAQDVFTAIESIAKAVEQKQEHDSVLDTLVDLSIYEKISLINEHYLVVGLSAAASFLEITVPFCSPKKVTPTVSIRLNSVMLLGGYSPALSTIQLVGTYLTRTKVQFIFTINDATAKAQGTCSAQVTGEIIADCKGRI